MAEIEADATLMAAITAVYDHVPQDAVFPYIAIGDVTSVPFDTYDTVGDEQTLMLHTWSEYRGRKEIKTLQGLVYDVLNRAELSLSGGTAIGCDQELVEDFIDADGLRRHGVQRFRVIIDD